MKVLVVDDDKSVRDSMRTVLNGAGYEVVLAADGQQAMTQFASHQIDLLLLDLGLPVRSGWDAFEHISNVNPLLPIIIITGLADKYDVTAAAGVGALMEKPLDAVQLLRTIRELLSEPKEARLHRLCGHGGDVRHIPPDNALFLKRLREQLATPYRLTLPQGHKLP